jgi:peptidoglycan/LPS O-acetylase OafA/YrhL
MNQVAELPTSTLKGTIYRPELDILRFFAFLLVFMTHTEAQSADHLGGHGVPVVIARALASFAIGGRMGVDLFFMLSAYLITDLLLREKAIFGQLNVPAFYVRRALRIWPLYFGFIAAVKLFPALEIPNSTFSKVNLIAFLLFVGNWSFVFLGSVYSVLGPLWSVSIEEQFYLVWPPIVSRLSRNGILIASAVMIFIANGDRAIEIVLYGHSLGKMWENTFVHMDLFAVGIAIAVLLDGAAPQFKWIYRVLMFAGGLLCFAVRGGAMFDAATGQGLLALFSYPTVVIGCALFLLAFLGAPIRSRTLEYLGKISYGLYVYHTAAVEFIYRSYPGHGVIHEILRIVLCLLATIAISAISYAILEKPFLLLKKRFTFVKSRPA